MEGLGWPEAPAQRPTCLTMKVSPSSPLSPGPLLQKAPAPHLPLPAQPAVRQVPGRQVPLLRRLEEHQHLGGCLQSGHSGPLREPGLGWPLRDFHLCHMAWLPFLHSPDPAPQTALLPSTCIHARARARAHTHVHADPKHMVGQAGPGVPASGCGPRGARPVVSWVWLPEELGNRKGSPFP